MRATVFPSGSRQRGLPAASPDLLDDFGLDAPTAQHSQLGIEVGDRECDQRSPGPLLVHDEVEPAGVGGGPPHDLVLVGDDVGRATEQLLVPRTNGVEVRDGDAGEEDLGIHAGCRLRDHRAEPCGPFAFSHQASRLHTLSVAR